MYEEGLLPQVLSYFICFDYLKMYGEGFITSECFHTMLYGLSCHVLSFLFFSLFFIFVNLMNFSGVIHPYLMYTSFPFLYPFYILYVLLLSCVYLYSFHIYWEQCMKRVLLSRLFPYIIYLFMVYPMLSSSAIIYSVSLLSCAALFIIFF